MGNCQQSVVPVLTGIRKKDSWTLSRFTSRIKSTIPGSMTLHAPRIISWKSINNCLSNAADRITSWTSAEATTASDSVVLVNSVTALHHRNNYRLTANPAILRPQQAPQNIDVWRRLSQAALRCCDRRNKLAKKLSPSIRSMFSGTSLWRRILNRAQSVSGTEATFWSTNNDQHVTLNCRSAFDNLSSKTNTRATVIFN